MNIYNRNSIQTRGGVAQALLHDLGPGAHPRVSIQGGQFALLDAGGKRYGAPVILQQTEQGQRLTLLAIIIGSNPNRSRIFYSSKYDPDNPLPPDCWSDNGTAPSANAANPQARTCGECEWQKWGSDTSQLTGKKTKACQEKKKIGLLIVGDTTRLPHELQIPPATLKNLAQYVSEITAAQAPGQTRKADPSDVITAISFVSGQTGILEFAPYAWLNSCHVDEHGTIQIAYDAQARPVDAPDHGESIAQLIDAVWESNALDRMLGLDDEPWTPPMLHAPLPGMQQGLHHALTSGGAQSSGMPAVQGGPATIASPTAAAAPAPGHVSTPVRPAFTPPNPFSPPAGTTVTPMPKPAVVSIGPPPSVGMTPQHSETTAQVQPAPMPRGPGRPRKTPQQQAPAPVDVPPFLDRKENGLQQSFGGSAAPSSPPGSIQAAIDAAYKLPTTPRREPS